MNNTLADNNNPTSLQANDKLAGLRLLIALI